MHETAVTKLPCLKFHLGCGESLAIAEWYHDFCRKCARSQGTKGTV